MRKASWILLTVVGVLWFAASTASWSVSYFSPETDSIAGRSMTNLDVPENVKIAMRARRGTAGAYGAAYAVLFLVLTLVPYRRGEKWAWWALLAGPAVILVVTLLRIPTLQTNLGVGSAVTPFVLTLVALLLDVGRLRRP